MGGGSRFAKKAPEAPDLEFLDRLLADGRVFLIGVQGWIANAPGRMSGDEETIFNGVEWVARPAQRNAGWLLMEEMRGLAGECAQECQIIHQARIEISMDRPYGNMYPPMFFATIHAPEQERSGLAAACAMWMNRAQKKLGVAFLPVPAHSTLKTMQTARDQVVHAMQEAAELAREARLAGEASGAASPVDESGAGETPAKRAQASRL